MGNYGTLGVDVGVVGRWGRLLLGGLIVLSSVSILFQVFTESARPLSFIGPAVFYFALILGIYTTVHYLFGERLFSKANPWVNTLILVVPAVIGLIWNGTFSFLTSLTLPNPFVFALSAYIGIGLVLQWKIKYGGCEVVSIPSILLRRTYKTYCVAFAPLDYVEKKVVDRKKAVNTA